MTDFAARVASYVGTPYEEAPCWELLRRVYRDALGIELPSYEYGRTCEEIHPVVRRGLPQWREVERASAEPGDAVLLWVRRPSLPSHVGVYLGDGRMLHTAEATGAVIERLDAGFWEKRVAGFYRHESRYDGWTLRVLPHPFAPGPTEVKVPCGTSIHAALLRSGIRRERKGQIRVRIGEEAIPPEWWGRVRPRAGIVVDAASVPSDPVSLFLAIGGAVGSGLIGTSAAIAAPLAIAAGVLGTAAIYTGLYFASTALAARPEQGGQSGARGPAASPQAAGVGNRLDPWGPVPVPYGRDMRVYPPLAAPAYTEIVAGERYWRMLLCVGAGRLYIDRTGETGRSGIEVGGIPIEDISGAEFEVFDGARDDYEDTVVDDEPSADPRQATPVGYWRLGSLASAVGGGALTATGGTTTGNASILQGQTGGSADFDGTNDYLETATPPLASLAGDWTIKFWFRPDGWGSRTLLSSGANRGVEIAQSSEGIEVIGGGTTLRVAMAGTSTGFWGRRGHLLALRSRSGQLDLTIDSARFPLGTTPSYSAPDRLTLGARRTGSGTYAKFYDGGLQEVALYNVALSDDELHLLYDLGDTVGGNPSAPTTGTWQSRILRDSPQEVPVNIAIPAPVASDGAGFVGQWITREIPGPVDRLEVEVFFPSGIYRINDEGKKRAASVGFEIQYRLSGGDWISATSAQATTTSHVRRLSSTYFGVGTVNNSDGPVIQEPILGGVYWDVPSGSGYEIRYRVIATETVNNRAGVGNGNNTLAFFGDHELLAFRGVRRMSAPVRTTGVAYLGVSLPVRETGATVNEISCLVSSMLRTVSGGVLSTAYTVTNNAAWVMLDKLIGPASNPRPQASSACDLAAFESFAARAEAYNLYEDFRSNVKDSCDLTGAGSFASLGYNGKWTPIEDRSGLTASQLITNRNSRSLGGVLRRPDLAHALRVQFIDENLGWQEREIVVYDDGYNADGSDGNDPASKYESIEIRGLTTEAAVHENVRIRLAMARLRNEEWRREMFLDAVRVHRGDVAKLQDWSSLVGQHSARVVSRTVSGGTHVTAIVVDETIVYEGAVNYGLVWRQPDGTVRRADVANPGAAESTTITFVAGQLLAEAPAAGDLVAFGERNEETVDVLVREVIRKGRVAELALIPYVPAVFSAGLGPVPFAPVVGRPIPLVEYNTPPYPILDRIESDERWLLVTQDGVQPQMRVWVKRRFPRDRSTRAQVRYRPRGTEAWSYSAWGTPSPDSIVVGPVETGAVMELQGRVAAEDGRTSPWSPIIAHTVVGTSTPPPDVTEVRVDGDLVTWVYNPAEVPDLAGFRVRFVYGQARNPGAVWNGAAVVSDLVRGQSIPVSAIPTGVSVTVLVKAVDVGGNESATPASVVFFGRLQSRDVVATLMSSAVDLWNGTKLNGSVSGSDLVATLTAGDGIDDPMWGDPEAPMFALDTSLDLFGAVSKRMTYYRSVTVPKYAEGRRMWTELTFTPPSAHPRIEWAYYGPAPMFSADELDPMFGTGTTDEMFGADTEDMFGASSDPMWPDGWMWPGPIFTDYAVWPGQIESPRAIEYVFRVTVPAMPGGVAARLTLFRLLSDVDDLVEVLNDVAISAAGSRLPITKSFTLIQHVSLVLQQIAGQTGRTVELVDRQAYGPMVRVLDASGAQVAGTIDAEVRGVPLFN